MTNREVLEAEILRLETKLQTIKAVLNDTDSGLAEEIVNNVEFETILRNPQACHIKQRSALHWDVVKVNNAFSRGGHKVLVFITVREKLSKADAVKAAAESNERIKGEY